VSARRWFGRRTRKATVDGIRGQALLEFALALPVFLLLLVGLFDLGRAVFSYNTLTNAAREGARLAIVNQDKASIIAHAEAQSAMVELDVPNVDVHFYDVNADGTADTNHTCTAVGCLAVVSFQATYRPITPIISNILFSGGVTMTATSELTIEYACPNSYFTTANKCPKQP
jgi:Flp pilus assembly protein TadG